VILDACCAGLTRACVEKSSSSVELMICRVKPGMTEVSQDQWKEPGELPGPEEGHET
jgi:hypothetical protein